MVKPQDSGVVRHNMKTSGILIQVSTSRIPDVMGGEMAVHLPDGRLFHWDHMTDQQRDQLMALQQDRAPDMVCYIWRVDAEGPDVDVEIEPSPTAPTKTLGDWLGEDQS